MKDRDYAGLAMADATRAPWLDSFFLAIIWLGSLAVLLPPPALCGLFLH